MPDQCPKCASGRKRQPSSEPWLTKREVAARYRGCTRTVERHPETFPARRVGGQNRYLESEIDASLPPADAGGGSR